MWLKCKKLCLGIYSVCIVLYMYINEFTPGTKYFHGLPHTTYHNPFIISLVFSLMFSSRSRIWRLLSSDYLCQRYLILTSCCCHRSHLPFFRWLCCWLFSCLFLIILLLRLTNHRKNNMLYIIMIWYTFQCLTNLCSIRSHQKERCINNQKSAGFRLGFWLHYHNWMIDIMSDQCIFKNIMPQCIKS